MAGTSATAKVYTELCTNCGHKVTFDAEHIHRENPYWPWLDTREVQNFRGDIRDLAKCVKELTETIRTPDRGLIGQIRSLVTQFERFLGPAVAPSTDEPKGSEG